MGLADVQRITALLATDAEIRARFASDPEAALHSIGASDDDIVVLRRLSVKDLELFATGLLRKREGAVRDLIPLSASLLGRDFAAEFREFSLSNHPTGVKKTH